MSSWEEGAGGRKKKAILGDVMEALLGALYVDGGLDAARGVFERMNRFKSQLTLDFF